MKIGDRIEDFTLPVTGGGDSSDSDSTFTLSAATTAGKIVVLYFYPKDDTPGCTIESNDFSALLDDFTHLNAVVLGISRDTLRSHDKFRAKYDYRHHLLADTEAMLCDRFAVLKPKTMFGKPVTGISRSTFIIGSDQRLRYEWRNIKEVTGHAAEVLEKTRTLADDA